MSELKIVAIITVKPDFQREMENIFRAVVDGTRTEEGNISYELHQDTNNPINYIILESWKSAEAIKAHNQTSHYLNFKKEIEGKIEGLTVNVIKKVY